MTMGVGNDEQIKSFLWFSNGYGFSNTSEMLKNRSVVFHIWQMNNVNQLIIIVQKYFHNQYYFMMMYVGNE